MSARFLPHPGQIRYVSYSLSSLDGEFKSPILKSSDEEVYVIVLSSFALAPGQKHFFLQQLLQHGVVAPAPTPKPALPLSLTGTHEASFGFYFIFLFWVD